MNPIKTAFIESRRGINPKTGKRDKVIGYDAVIRFKDPNRENIRKGFGKREKLIARDFLERKKSEVLNNTVTTTLKECVEGYLHSKRNSESKTLGKRYWVAPFNNMSLLEDFETILINELNTSRLDHFLSRLYKKITVTLARPRKNLKQEVDLLSASFYFYKGTKNPGFTVPLTPELKEEWGLSRKERKSRKERLKVSFSQEELHAVMDSLYQAPDICFYVLGWLMFSFGLRISEALGVEWKNIDFENKYVEITGQILTRDENNKRITPTKVHYLKHQSDRGGRPFMRLQLSKELEKVLKKVKGLNRNSIFVVANKKGDVPSQDRCRYWLKKTGHFTEQGITSHKIRKTVNTLCKIPDDETEELLRHTSKAVNDLYTDDLLVSEKNRIPLIMGQLLSRHTFFEKTE